MPATASLSESHHPEYRSDRRLPAGAIDCHMHIYGPPDRFGPPTLNGLCGRAHLADYLALRQQLGLARTVYVQPSHYADDNSCMLAAMAADPAPARGVAVIGAAGPDSDFAALHAAGVRGAGEVGGVRVGPRQGGDAPGGHALAARQTHREPPARDDRDERAP